MDQRFEPIRVKNDLCFIHFRGLGWLVEAGEVLNPQFQGFDQASILRIDRYSVMQTLQFELEEQGSLRLQIVGF